MQFVTYNMNALYNGSIVLLILIYANLNTKFLDLVTNAFPIVYDSRLYL